MAKPIVKTMHAFDASMPYTVEFVWSGNQAYANRMVIYDASSQTVVFDDLTTVEKYRLQHVIPAGALLNNKNYAVQISVTDINGGISPFSDKYYFVTVETPAFYFDGLTDGQTVYSPNIALSLEYAQSGQEKLMWTQYHLYDAAKILINESEPDYSCPLTYGFSSLNNNITYYVRATAVTEHGMALDTGYIGFVPSYKNPSAYARIYAENDEDTGFVNYYSNIIIISPDEEDYEYDDGYIDLTYVDPLKVLSLSLTSSLATTGEVHWTDISGNAQTSIWANTSEGFSIVGYRYANEITIYGNTSQTSTNPYEYRDILGVNDIRLGINDTVIQDLSEGNPLNKLPSGNCDSLTLRKDGTRTCLQEVGYYTFSGSDTAIQTETVSGDFITYYDLGGLVNSLSTDMYCSCLPVSESGSQPRISLDPETGYVKINWGAQYAIESDVQEFYRTHNVDILFPLNKANYIRLSQVSPLPDLVNRKLLRYSHQLVIPGSPATFAIRMRSCRRNADILRVYCDEEIDFILSSIVYEDNTYRLKLTVYGNGPTYTQYSNILNIDNDDIVTVFIRRCGDKIGEGADAIYTTNHLLYGLYATTEEASDIDYNDIWLGVPEPGISSIASPRTKDLWIDLEQDLVYISHEDGVRIYQVTEPLDADVNNMWIGGEL